MSKKTKISVRTNFEEEGNEIGRPLVVLKPDLVYK